MNVLITGGAGSLGQALARRLLDIGAARVVVFSRDEYKHAVMREAMPDPRLRFFLGDVRDKDRLVLALRGIETVIHAAALKRIDALEYDPREAERTNVWGAMNVIEAAVTTSSVRKVLLISTDKACAPSSVYGASKLFAERLFAAANSYSGAGGPIFAAVRYGNVAGSRGSVIPTWRAMVKADRTPVLTDPRMSRFWVRMPQAVDLVMLALDRMRGGEVYIPKLWSFWVADLWHAMCGSGEPHVMGRRPGEKLHESLISAHESPDAYDLGDVYCICRPVAGEAEPRTMGQLVADGWEYCSGENDRWLDASALEAEIERLEEAV